MKPFISIAKQVTGVCGTVPFSLQMSAVPPCGKLPTFSEDDLALFSLQSCILKEQKSKEGMSLAASASILLSHSPLCTTVTRGVSPLEKTPAPNHSLPPFPL